MNPAVLAIVLTAALLHALWNALVKASDNRTIVLGLISLGHVIFGIILAFNFPPPDPASWPFIAASTIIHFAYYYLLNRSYHSGDLSLTYPIARGISPVLITLGALVFAGESMSGGAWLGIFIVTGGIFLLSAASRHRPLAPGILFTALATGLTIAAYSLADGMGARASVSALGYIGWLFILEVFVTLFVAVHSREALKSVPTKVLTMGIVGGFISATAYGLVIFAKTLAPLGAVSTLRETSVLFATLIGVLIFGERPWRRRMIGAAIIVAGVILLSVSAG